MNLEERKKFENLEAKVEYLMNVIWTLEEKVKEATRPPVPKGERGYEGYLGIHDLPGLPGDKGERGYEGFPGLPGDKGEKGYGGYSGISGIKGEKGESGMLDHSYPIPEGAPGPAGSPGLPGSPGGKGERGEPGGDAKPEDVADILLSSEKFRRVLLDTPITELQGKTFGNYIDQDLPKIIAGDRDLRESIKGEKGDQGLRGEVGLQGQVGPRGENGTPGKDGSPGINGLPGARGEKGPQGPAGPRGEKGDMGTLGPVGPQGADGAPGRVGLKGEKGDASSATEIATELVTSKKAELGEAVLNANGIKGENLATQIAGKINLNSQELVNKIDVAKLTEEVVSKLSLEEAKNIIKDTVSEITSDAAKENNPDPIAFRKYEKFAEELAKLLVDRSSMSEIEVNNFIKDKVSNWALARYLLLHSDLNKQPKALEIVRQEIDKESLVEYLLEYAKLKGDVNAAKTIVENIVRQFFDTKKVGELGRAVLEAKDDKGKKILVDDPALQEGIAEELRRNPGKIKGPKGEKGEIGSKGDTGTSGAPGSKGDIGLPGPQGFNGTQGEKGDLGLKGDRGEIGLPGAPGITGEKGDQGGTDLVGPKGDKGDMGDRGDTGAQGPKGDKGPVGLQGIQGLQGFNGTQGEKGDLGQAGTKGDEGARGPVGPKGDKGDIGPIGHQGNTGDKGIQGPQGFNGTQGEKGDPGLKGDRGKIGLPGAPGITGEKSDAGPKGDTGPVGPKGVDGAPGIDGLKGEAGPVGPKGDTGPTGPQGPKGENGIGADVANQFLYEIKKAKNETLDAKKAAEVAKNASERSAKEAKSAKEEVVGLHDKAANLTKKAEAFKEEADNFANQVFQSENNVQALHSKVQGIFCRTSPRDQVCTASRGKREAERKEYFNDQPAISGASRSSSWINVFANTIVDAVKGTSQFISSSFKPAIGYDNSQPSKAVTTQDVDINGTLLLLDVFIRKITGRKYISTADQPAFSLEELNCYASYITTEFERALEYAAVKSGISFKNLSFNPVPVESAIFEHINKGQYSKIPKILYSSAKEACSNCKQTDKFLAIFKDHMERTLASNEQPRNAVNTEKITTDNERPRSFMSDVTPSSSFKAIYLKAVNCLR